MAPPIGPTLAPPSAALLARFRARANAGTAFIAPSTVLEHQTGKTPICGRRTGPCVCRASSSARALAVGRALDALAGGPPAPRQPQVEAEGLALPVEGGAAAAASSASAGVLAALILPRRR